MQMNVINNIQQMLTMSLGTDKAVQSVALGVGIAYAMPIPADAREAKGMVNSYYTNHFFSQIDTMLSELNEVFLIEIQTVHDVARTVWTMRYRSVYLSEEDIADLASKANPLRDYLMSFQLEEARLAQVMATGVQLANLLRANDILQTSIVVRG